LAKIETRLDGELNCVKTAGKEYWYVRIDRKPGSPKKRIKAPHGTPEFLAEAQVAVTQLRLASKTLEDTGHDGTLADLWNRYLKSHTPGRFGRGFRRLAPSTQTQKLRRMTPVIEQYGHLPWNELEVGEVSTIRDRIIDAAEGTADGIEAGNCFVKDLGSLLTWGKRNHRKLLPRGWQNPCEGLKDDRSNEQVDGHHTWSESEIDQFFDRWPLGTMQHMAATALLETGLRSSDVVRISDDHIINERLELVTQKTSHKLSLPISDELRAARQASVKSSPVINMQRSWLFRRDGQPFASPKSFANFIKRAAAAADIPKHCTPHGLRKSAAVRMAEAGATAAQMQAFFGWKDYREAEIYIRAANANTLTDAAQEKAHHVQKRVDFPRKLYKINEGDKLTG
tara:strand:+ start:256 stop:1446 length:1191 start_codon:yes stop_codon:yes gene_type:complete